MKNEQLKEANAQRAENEAINFWKKKAQNAELEVADLKETINKKNMAIKNLAQEHAKEMDDKQQECERIFAAAEEQRKECEHVKDLNKNYEDVVFK